jgi:hypothetical protein
MAASPSFISTPRIGRLSLSTANTATDGTGTINDLIVGASAGTRVLSVNVQGTATTVAALVNLFLWDGTQWDRQQHRQGLSPGDGIHGSGATERELQAGRHD